MRILIVFPLNQINQNSKKHGHLSPEQTSVVKSFEAQGYQVEVHIHKETEWKERLILGDLKNPQLSARNMLVDMLGSIVYKACEMRCKSILFYLCASRENLFFKPRKPCELARIHALAMCGLGIVNEIYLKRVVGPLPEVVAMREVSDGMRVLSVIKDQREAPALSRA